MNRQHFKIRNEGRCRLCERPNVPVVSRAEEGFTLPGNKRIAVVTAGRFLTRHHLVPQELGGTDRNENIVPLCRSCHDLIDAGPMLIRLIYRRMLRHKLSPGEVSYIRRRQGEKWLEKWYPS